jgi:hypothetical protein
MSLKRITTKIINANYLFLLIAIAQLLFAVSANAQDINNLKILGNNVQFSYNTLNQFNTGITLDGWTRINAKFRYEGSNGWEIRMYALSSQIEYEGGEPSDNIDLADLEIIPFIISGSGTTDLTAAINTSFILATDEDEIIAEGDGGTVGSDPPVDIELTISYKMGNMINKPEGLYFVSVRLILVEK